MSEVIARLIDPLPGGSNIENVTSGTCTAWDAITFASTVVVGGAVTYVNLPIISPALATMGTGLVLLLRSDRGPIILGRLTVPA